MLGAEGATCGWESDSWRVDYHWLLLLLLLMEPVHKPCVSSAHPPSDYSSQIGTIAVCIIQLAQLHLILIVHHLLHRRLLSLLNATAIQGRCGTSTHL